MPRAQAASLRWWPAVRSATDSVRSGPAGLIGMAIVVGGGAGLGAVVFRWLVVHAGLLFSGAADYAAVGPHGHPAHPWFPWLGAGFVVLAPAVGGLVYGPLVDRFAPEARGHGVPEVMYAVSQRGGRIKGRVAVVKALASAICIGSGGSVGREGPIVQIGSALGSYLGRLGRVPETRLRTLVACGAAGGIAATFNAPVAGVFFALELLLRDFAAEAFGAVVLAAVTASVIGRGVFGDHPFLDLPLFTIASPVEYLLYAGLGLLAGVTGVLFTKVLYAVEDACDRLWRGPSWARPAVGGLLLGALLLAVPHLYGVGYPVLQDAVEGRYTVALLLVLVLGKMLATSLTIGIGGSGGVFAPSLFCGAMLGAAFGDLVQLVLPGSSGSVGAYALVGMGAVFAGAARAPITAVLILFEITGEYSIILPLMLAIVVATGVSRLLSRDTVYTLKLRRRGIDVDAAHPRPVLSDRVVADVMEPVPPTLAVDTDVRRAARQLLVTGRQALPVVRADGVVTGLLTSRVAAEVLADDMESETSTAGQLAEAPATVRPTTPLGDALDVLLHADPAGVPVLDADDGLAGWLTHQGVLRALAAPAGAAPRRGGTGPTQSRPAAHLSTGTSTGAASTSMPSATSTASSRSGAAGLPRRSRSAGSMPRAYVGARTPDGSDT